MSAPDSTLAHTADEALARFTLISGAGSEATNQACAMTALAWMAGAAWTARMECAHPLIRQNVIAANDTATTTPEMRAELVRAGVDGVIDTWWIPATEIVWALAQAPKDSTFFDRVLNALRLVGAWKADKERHVLRDAVLRGADLRDADLRDADLSGAYYSVRTRWPDGFDAAAKGARKL
jgi:hypothetical protein